MSPRIDPTEQWIHEEIVRAYGMENETWALEQLKRVMFELNRARGRAKRKLEAIVLGVSPMNAFILPGRHLYITRRLLERLGADAAVAFILAHEVAHFDLGHLEPLGRWAARIPRGLPSEAIAVLLGQLAQRLHGKRHEFAADERGLELCAKAGYELGDALSALDILKANLLDYGHIDAVYGEEEPDDDNPLDRLFSRARGWVSDTLNTHPALEARRTALVAVRARLELPAARRLRPSSRPRRGKPGSGSPS